jgi:glycosyltransferase involved in cell wall biosynthesis
MIFVAYFIFGFMLIRFLVAVANYIFDPRLKPARINEKPLVSILIPARNEEKNIGNILNDLCYQDYQNIEIIVFNDGSTDNTNKVVAEFAARFPKIKILGSPTLPKGWLGKNYGCYNLSKNANGRYFLFLDADVRVQSTLVESAIAHLQKHKLGLVSIFPKQQMVTLGEKISVPVMNTILLSLLPLVLVRLSKRPSLAAANGQFMLFDANVYKKMQPHERMKSNKVEDIATARYFKSEGIKIDCLTGNQTISCRMYTCYSDAILGFTKNMASFFGNSIFLAILYWLITTFGIFVVLLGLPIKCSFVYIICGLICRVLISIVSNQNIFENIIYLVPQQFSAGLINYKTVTNNFLKRNKWKDRNID